MDQICADFTDSQMALLALGVIVALFLFHRLLWWAIAALFGAVVLGMALPTDPLANWIGAHAAVLVVPLLLLGIFSFGLRLMFRSFGRNRSCSCHCRRIRY
jgi:hypothetical protein